MRQYLWVLILLFISPIVNAQQIQRQRVGANTVLLNAKVAPQQFKAFSGVEATAVAIRYEGALGEAYIVVDGKEYPLTQDDHYFGEGSATNLMVFDEGISQFDLFTGDITGDIKIVSIDAGKAKEVKEMPRLDNQQEECSRPAMIDQSVWREGLPEPSYSRSFTITENIIVHHSATSNDVNDYTNVVRNIYLYHTQSNGWSDIGYNYLIAPDGTIFKGRDPGSGDQDKVIGAHFCGKNSTTMGICLMGTYSQVSPSDETLTALSQLLAWKTDKDELDPFGVNSHPLNASLPVIAGHRDGCSTECPGQQTYERLAEIRSATAETIDSCGEEEEPLEFALHPNPAAFYFRVELVDGGKHAFGLYDMRGEFFDISPTSVQDEVATFSTGGLSSGVYVLHYQTEDVLVKRRLIISN